MMKGGPVAVARRRLRRQSKQGRAEESALIGAGLGESMPVRLDTKVPRLVINEQKRWPDFSQFLCGFFWGGGTQTLAGAYSLARSTIDQMAIRIALQCSDSDSRLILSDENSAARLLTRPNDAIYNNANGLVEGNLAFQVTWLDDEESGRLPHCAQAGGRRELEGIIRKVAADVRERIEDAEAAPRDAVYLFLYGLQ
ncbi:MAG: hypothetical protein HUU20_25830 [Pirellulales bacterium]|nr:hypothetical protein [Pirellulales bacterium]